MLGDMHFLDTLREFDKDNIPTANVKKIRDNYINNQDFNPEIIKNVSSACEGLCKWVRAIDVYDSVAKASVVSRTVSLRWRWLVVCSHSDSVTNIVGVGVGVGVGGGGGGGGVGWG